jgi:hypothetical protein
MHACIYDLKQPDKAFVVRFVVFFPDEQYTLDDEYETKNDQFRFFITTRRIGNGFRDADAIGNGFRESKCDCGVRGNCWFHCKKNVLKEIACVKDVKKKAALLEGICELQICPTPGIFKAASALFVRLWFGLIKLL